MAFKDYYKILGVEKTATPAAIKKAYHKLAIQFHPDNNKSDKRAEEKFQEINAANTVLSDPEKRKLYDKYGEHWEHPPQEQPRSNGQRAGNNRQQAGRQQPFGFDSSDFDQNDNFEDIFSQFYGRAQNNRNAPRNGQDVAAEVSISLEDAFSGATHQLTIGGEQHRLTLKKGVDEGKQYKLRGKGQPGTNGGPNGDLMVSIRITPHVRYTRTGNDLRCKQSVDLLTAVLGGKARVQTLHGEKMMTLQPGTQNGATLRMRGLGMPDYNRPDTFGDLYVEISVQIPTQLSEKERELYTQLSLLRRYRRLLEVDSFYSHREVVL